MHDRRYKHTKLFTKHNRVKIIWYSRCRWKDNTARDLKRISGEEVTFRCSDLGGASDPVEASNMLLFDSCLKILLTLCPTWQACGLILTNQYGTLILFSFVFIYLLICLFLPYLSLSFLSTEKVHQNPQYLSFKARVLRSLRLSLIKSIERLVESYGKNPFVNIIKGHSKLDW
jgi:hypothetical protein